ncbi:serpin family protein [Terrimonas sp. NA20]|uniref:Serpin family protein n=1 Tax=Terrimonas ginsenosidimutans TaxID=2908004 RepID=A0ABS9KZI7_9BACT|nr:serpin family protein [Terrimonas ginsenosidimutans]MCG2617733.1 serpin family protein [Terrimonas ginsenosidimutans]
MEVLFNKWLMSLLITCMIFSKNEASEEAGTKHPIHLSVTEINHNAQDKTLEISCKIFTDDFEKVLAQNYRTKVDLTNPPDKAAMEKLVNDYVQKHLSVKADGKPAAFTALGFEKDQDVVYSYFQVDNVASVKSIGITNTLMYDLFDDQISLMHITVGGKRKSGKLDYPAKETIFSF